MYQIALIFFTKVISFEAISKKINRLSADYVTSWTFICREFVADFEIKIPKGFEWDGATIPRIVWSLLGLTPTGILLVASLIHDFIYIHKGRTEGNEFISRLHCDLLFYEHCLKSGLNEKEAKLIYNFIRKLGWIYWCDNWLFDKLHKRN